MRVVVVGAGIVGVSVAEAIASAGAGVTVLDMRSPGRGATRASAGILAPYVEADADSPLLPLAVRSLALFDAFIARLAGRSGRPIEYRRDGTLQVAATEADAGRLSAEYRWLTSISVVAEWIAPRAIAEFEPAASPSAAGGVFIPMHGFVNVPSLMKALVDAAIVSGATFESPVDIVRIEPKDDHVLVSADGRTYTADAVVVATGSWSRRIRIGGATPLPVRPVRGQMLHLAWPDPPRPARVVWGERCYVVPWEDGSVLVGATVEEAGFDERPTVAGLQTLTSAVMDLLPAAKRASIVEVRVGLRPAMPDGLPAIGPLPSMPRVVAATGHFRNGILLAPLTAALVTRYVLEGITDEAIAVTTPGRFVR